VVGIAFDSSAGDLVEGDYNLVRDVFLWRLAPQTEDRRTLAPAGSLRWENSSVRDGHLPLEVPANPGAQGAQFGTLVQPTPDKLLHVEFGGLFLDHTLASVAWQNSTPDAAP
jgi:hypothetical protein